MAAPGLLPSSTAMPTPLAGQGEGSASLQAGSRHSQLPAVTPAQRAAQGTGALGSLRHREKLPGCWGDAGGQPQLQGGDQAWPPSPSLHHHQPLDARRGIFALCLSQMTPGDQHPPSQGREREALSNPRTICWLKTDQSGAALRWRLQSHPRVLLAQHWIEPEMGAEPCYTQLLCLRQPSPGFTA